MFIRILIVVAIVAGFAGLVHWYGNSNSRPEGRGVFLGELSLPEEQSQQVDNLLAGTHEEVTEASDNWIQ